jgi:hypothetical protein
MLFAIEQFGLLVGGLSGVYLGERWAIRQISNKETRKHLSNPNKEKLNPLLRYFD